MVVAIDVPVPAGLAAVVVVPIAGAEARPPVTVVLTSPLIINKELAIGKSKYSFSLTLKKFL